MSETIPVVPETVETPVAPPEVSSLREHREAYPATNRRNVLAPETTETIEKPIRHRAQSQKAGIEDVAQIEEYTKRLRAAEESAGIEKKAGESDRVYQLRRRAELAERAKTPAAAVEVKTPTPPPPVVPREAPGAFTEKEPTIEQFRDQPDPYEAKVRAAAAYDRRKEAFESQMAAARTDTETQAKARQEQFAGWVKDVQTQHHARLTEFLKDPTAKATFDAHAALPDAEQVQFTPVMHVAIETSGQGPKFLLELLRHPELADQLVFETNGQLAFDGHGNQNPLVALLQRRLATRVQAAVTGSVVPTQKIKAPRPPNPVRTVPQTPPEKVSSEPSRSLADHRRRFGQA
jgi:hypothetical protein